jgi:hypothetical protein
MLCEMLMESPIKKSREIQKLLKEAVEEQGVSVKFLSAFGYKFDSAFWIAVQTDSERDKLRANEDLLQRLNAIIKESGYLQIIEDIWNKEIHNPDLEYLKTPGITFESQETADRVFKGNWYHCMQ